MSPAKIREFETALYKFMDAGHPEVVNSIAREKRLSTATSEALKGAGSGIQQGFK